MFHLRSFQTWFRLWRWLKKRLQIPYLIITGEKDTAVKPFEGENMHQWSLLWAVKLVTLVLTWIMQIFAVRLCTLLYFKLRRVTCQVLVASNTEEQGQLLINPDKVFYKSLQEHNFQRSLIQAKDMLNSWNQNISQMI